MPDLPSVTNFINSPPGQLAAGGVLAGIVWKFFDKVEAVLKDQTKFEIAVWLVGVEAGKKVQTWPDTFAKVFDRVFGAKHLTWRSFWRSAVSTTATILLMAGSIGPALTTDLSFRASVRFLLVLIPVALVPDYASLLITRKLISLMQKRPGTTFRLFILLIALCIGCIIAFGVVRLDWSIYDALLSKLLQLVPPPKEALFTRYADEELVFLAICAGGASLFTSIWLWLYAGSGFLLKFARRFDLGFQWFNRKFDIEKHPLSAIGLVAGSLVAILYWSWAAFRHFVPA